MAAGRIVVPPYFPARDRDFNLLAGALLYVYDNETTAKAAIYTNEGLTVLSSNPVVANSSGQFPAIFAEAGTEAEPVLYSIAVTTSTGASPGNPFVFDNYRPSVDWETAASALAEAAADAAAISAASAAGDLTSVEVIYDDILAIAATGSDAPAIAARALRDGSNLTGSDPADFRTAIAAVGTAALASSSGGTLVGNQLSAGTSVTVQTYAQYVGGGDLMPTMFSGTDQQQITRAITEAGQTRDGGAGQTVQLARGEYDSTATFNLDDRVVLQGVNKRGTAIKADAAHAGPSMITVDEGTTSMFDNRLDSLTLDCNNVAGLGGVLSDAWQEGGGARDVLVRQFRTYGIKFQDGDGGAALCSIRDSEFFGSGSGASPDAGILVDRIKLEGAFVLDVSNSTIAGGGGVALSRGIDVVGDSLNARSVHFELCTSGIYLDGNGAHVLESVTGLNNVTNVVEIASTFTGTLSLKGSKRDGATNLLLDNRANGLGTIPYDTDVQIGLTVGVGQIMAGGNFNGTSPDLDFVFGCSGIVQNATGEWTVTLSRPITGTDASSKYTVSVTSNHVSGRARASLNTASTIKIFDETFGGTPFDPSEINFQVWRCA